ncbi:MAG: HD domain-containing protein [Phycisphaerales bacterium]|nr:HD domain-containing protein [Phycisphaerales bacterium]
MPITLTIDELEPGMRLAQAVYNNAQLILAAGKTLEDWEIDGLRRRFPQITVRVGDPLLDEWVDFQDDSREQTVAVTVNRRMARMMQTVRSKLGTQTALEGPDLIALQVAVHEMMIYIQQNPVAAAMLMHMAEGSDYLQEHAANVFYLGLLIGSTIREYVYLERKRTTRARDLAVRFGMNLTPLAIGCLLHDLGMIALEPLLNKPGPLDATEREQVNRHPLLGAEMLPKQMDAVCRMVIRTHHENCCGTGYPSSVPSDSLHVFSRVIRVADAYDAGTSRRCYRQAKSAVRVLWEMSVGPLKDLYDPVVIRILTSLIQPFPIGAKIRIHDGRYVVVVRHNRKHPFRPTAIIAFDEHGNKLKKSQLRQPIDLSQNEDIRLIRYAEEDLAFLNDTVDFVAAPVSAGQAGEVDSMFNMVYP